MNFTKSVNVVHSRIQQLEPENDASKITGCLLLMQENGYCDMIRLAFSPDSVLRSVINSVKGSRYLNLPSDHISPPPPPPVISMRTSFLDDSTEMDPSQFLNYQDSPEFFSQEHHQALPPRTSRRSPSLHEFPVKICHYFKRGFCKHGNNCRYFHGQIIPERESFSQMFNPNNSSDEEHVVSPGSLEKLEREIIELLKSIKGEPISIAALPMMYYEYYGRNLQAEGYLTESQRHGKAGYSLTKLLARLNNTIRLIDRPHGQHAVVLAEDVSKFVEYTGERNDLSASARQIYLTFPVESSFTENDVSNYFSKFGHVEDVRIPCQQKRMFGFVTFCYTETVKRILAKSNPHFICGARVLVKPYREKSRTTTRYHDNNNNNKQYGSSSSQYIEMNTLSSRAMRKQFLEQPYYKSLPTNYSYPGFSSDDFKLTRNDFVAEQQEGQAEQLRYLMEYLNMDDNIMKIKTNYKENDGRIHCEALDSQALNLPDSPFSSLFGKEISTAT